MDENKGREICGRFFVEDALLSYYVLQIVERVHNLSIQRLYRHVFVKGKETDVIALATTKVNGIKRTVGFELKDTDIAKAIKQAKERRAYFDYLYIVINELPHTIANFLLSHSHSENFNFGIISTFPSHEFTVPVLLRKSPFEKSKILTIKGKASKTLDLVKFIRDFNKVKKRDSYRYLLYVRR